jgi:hypothetical protein
MTAVLQSIGTPKTIDPEMSLHMGVYSDAVVTPPGMVQVDVSGDPGLRAGAQLSDIVDASTWLTNADDLEPYVKIRDEIVEHKRAYMLVVVPQLARPCRPAIEVAAALASTASASGRGE